jgi:hypothetical protein
MLRSHAEDVVIHRNWQLRWETLLPKRKAWMQTLILLPFGLPVGNFLATSWQFSIEQLVEHHQYPIGILSMMLNLLLPSLFFAVLFHWCWFAWRVPGSSWYPRTPALAAGAYATLTIAVSFGVVALFASSLGICGDGGWHEIGRALLCNLDSYGFESKSWFGGWFILAAYCYQLRDSLDARAEALQRRLVRQRYAPTEPESLDELTAEASAPVDDFRTSAEETIGANSSD